MIRGCRRAPPISRDKRMMAARGDGRGRSSSRCRSVGRRKWFSAAPGGIRRSLRSFVIAHGQILFRAGDTSAQVYNMYAGADGARGVTIIFSLEIEATYLVHLLSSCVVRGVLASMKRERDREREETASARETISTHRSRAIREGVSREYVALLEIDRVVFHLIRISLWNALHRARARDLTNKGRFLDRRYRGDAMISIVTRSNPFRE